MKYNLFPLFHFPKSISIPSVPALIRENLYSTSTIPSHTLLAVKTGPPSSIFMGRAIGIETDSDMTIIRKDNAISRGCFKNGSLIFRLLETVTID